MENRKQGRCDDCLYYDYDETGFFKCCTMNLDEDEYEKFMSGSYRDCPYYKQYDEYKSVRRQN